MLVGVGGCGSVSECECVLVGVGGCGSVSECVSVCVCVLVGRCRYDFLRTWVTLLTHALPTT